MIFSCDRAPALYFMWSERCRVPRLLWQCGAPLFPVNRHRASRARFPNRSRRASSAASHVRRQSDRASFYCLARVRFVLFHRFRRHGRGARRFHEPACQVVRRPDGRDRHRSKPVWIAANNGEHQRQVIMGCADNRLQAATDPDPCLHGTAFDRGKYTLINEGRAGLAAPSPRQVPPHPPRFG